MSDDNIFLDFKLSKSEIGRFLQAEMDFICRDKLHAEGFIICLASVKNENVLISGREKTILVQVPLAFNFIKSAGLFSVEGEGSIRLNLEVNIDIDEQFCLHTKTILRHFDWMKEPVLHLGELNIPIETLSNCIINYTKNNALDKIDASITRLVDLRHIIHEQLKTYGYNYPIHNKPALFFNAQLVSVQSGVIYEDSDHLHLDIWLECVCKISDKEVKFEQKYNPQFYWTVDKPEKSNPQLEVEFTYFGIAKALMNELNGLEIGGKTFEPESIHIRKTTGVEIKASLLAPIKGIITVTCNPYLNHAEQKLYADNIQIDINASNFIYKISSPIIEKIIRSRISAALPFDPAPFFADFIKKIPTVSLLDNQLSFYPKVHQIILENLSFNERHLTCTVLLSDAELDIVV